VPAALTAQGAATRRRIVVATADLMARYGVARTTLDDVRAATSTSKSQLYHYFADKADLVRAVVEHHRDVVLAEQRLVEEPVDALPALARWRYRTVATHRKHGFTRPCPLGRLASELAGDDAARPALDSALTLWREQLAAGLATMLAEGRLRPDADPDRLATALLGAVQGGLLLASVARDGRPLQASLDAAIDYVTALATPTD
jgi:TetR/AcrR family transcriptional regulator, transcriptional repressor for nem operon